MVIDASIAIKWLKKDESERDKSLLIYKNHLIGKEKILVPDLLFLEVANSLATKSFFSKDDIEVGVNFIFRANLNNIRETKADILKASILAKEYKTSVYDMIYAVIAQNEKTILITADEKFIEKTGFKFVKNIKEL